MSSFLFGGLQVLLAIQTAQAAVVGTVRDDATGAPLAGAVVTLIDLDRTVLTDAHGRYALRNVPAGPQHLVIRFISYEERTLHALVPPEGVLGIDVSLRPEPIEVARLEARPRIELRGVEGGGSARFPDREVSIAAVRNHPLLAEPDAFQALGGGEVALSPESPSGLHIRGGASDQTAYVLDGIPVFSPYHTAGVFSAWNPDALSRLDLWSSAPSPALPDALSGAVSAVTRTPGPRLRAQGSLSTMQGRLTVDGPLGVAGAGYLVSLRSGFAGVIVPRDEASYLSGGTGDWLAKIEAPTFGGRLRLLGYESENEIDAAAVVEADDVAGPDPRRNAFEWESRSVGAEWVRAFSNAAVRVRGWTAEGSVEALWTASSGAPIDMGSSRQDQGLSAALEWDRSRTATVVGLRLRQSRTSYRLETDPADAPRRIDARTPVAAVFVQHTRPIGPRTELELGTSVAAAAGDLHAGPRARLRWTASEKLALSGSYARLYQFAQSLRNPESVVGGVFPADIFIGVGASDVPVARSDGLVLALDYRPLPGLRVGVQTYERDLDGLLLVAARDGGPFATGDFATGSGSVLGLSLDAALGERRYGLLASYGWQRVRFRYADSSYVPGHGAAHLIEAGAIVFPTPTSSLRLGVTGALGRRTTAVSGDLEWEACNLLDQGCEFAGSPHHGSEPLGATTLPAYWRIDLGVRKHWHVELAGRDALVGAFATLTNLLGRKNTLTYAAEPGSDEREEIEMRPLSPLVVGIDWRF